MADTDLKVIVKAKDQLFDEAEALIKKAKSEAVKEFAERLKEKVQNQYWYNYEKDVQVHRQVVSTDDIDNLVKEMVGED